MIVITVGIFVIGFIVGCIIAGLLDKFIMNYIEERLHDE